MAIAVPTLKMYMRNGFNTLLRGKHGVGKTQMIMQACEELGLKLAYYSASTLDPYTDLVGVPVPAEITMHDGKVIKILESIRPHTIDDADIVFFDELNRAELKTLNAILEITQFHAINGEKLKKLRAVFAAINPPEDNEYQVNSLDPALVDRFQFIIDMDHRPNPGYLTGSLAKTQSPAKLSKGATGKDAEFGLDRATEVVNGMMHWYDTLKNNAGYISPRKLESIGYTIMTLQDDGAKYHELQAAVEHSMPPGVWPHAALCAAILGDPALDPDNSDFDYSTAEPHWILEEADGDKMAEWLKTEKDTDKRNLVIACIGSSTRPDQFIDRFAPVIEVLKKNDYKIMTSEWAMAKYEIINGLAGQATDEQLSQTARDNFKKWAKVTES